MTVTNPTDADLVEAALAGSREAFDAIVERHRRNVYQLCYRFVGNEADAADLAQDVFVRAYRGLKNFKGQASIGTWLYRIGVNVCLNRLASKTPPAGRRLSGAPLSAPEAGQPTRERSEPAELVSAAGCDRR